MNDEYSTFSDGTATGRSVGDAAALAGELRWGDAFGKHLIQLVEAHMNGHLEAGSVDEWHHTVLDDLISAAVALEMSRIDESGNALRVGLNASLAAAELEIDELAKRANDAAELVGPAQARVAQAEARLLSETADSPAVAHGQGGPARLAQVVAQIAELRSAMAASLERAGATSPSALPAEIGFTEARVASVRRRIQQQEKRVEQAHEALERLGAAAPVEPPTDPDGDPGSPATDLGRDEAEPTPRDMRMDAAA